MRESLFTRNVVNDLRKCNALVYPLVAGKRAPVGWPDRYVHHAYWCGFLEFKGEETVVSKLQRVVIKQLNSRVPGSAYIVRAPGWVLDADDTVLAGFDGSGKDLLNVLVYLTKQVRT